MKFFKFICWFRGYHVFDYALTAFIPPEIDGLGVQKKPGDVYGTIHPCRACGLFVQPPEIKNKGTIQLRVPL